MKEADIVAADISGERAMGKYTGRRLYPTQDEIAQLAFSFYESRGRQDGHDLEDWRHAEQGSLNRVLNFRTCSKVRFRCRVMNIETALSEPN